MPAPQPSPGIRAPSVRGSSVGDPSVRAGQPYWRWLLRLLVSLVAAWFCAHGFAAAHWSLLPHAARPIAGQMAAFAVFPTVAFLAFTVRSPVRALIPCALLGLAAFAAGFSP